MGEVRIIPFRSRALLSGHSRLFPRRVVFVSAGAFAAGRHVPSVLLCVLEPLVALVRDPKGFLGGEKKKGRLCGQDRIDSAQCVNLAHRASFARQVNLLGISDIRPHDFKSATKYTHVNNHEGTRVLKLSQWPRCMYPLLLCNYVPILTFPLGPLFFSSFFFFACRLSIRIRQSYTVRTHASRILCSP